MSRQLVLPVVLMVLCATLALPVSARADDGDDRREVRRAGACTGPSDMSLRVRVDDGSLRVELEVEARSRARWTVILLHERRIAYRGALGNGHGSSFKLRYTVPDWPGVDRIVARVTGPRQETCRVEATV